MRLQLVGLIALILLVSFGRLIWDFIRRGRKLAEESKLRLLAGYDLAVAKDELTRTRNGARQAIRDLDDERHVLRVKLVAAENAPGISIDQYEAARTAAATLQGRAEEAERRLASASSELERVKGLYKTRTAELDAATIAEIKMRESLIEVQYEGREVPAYEKNITIAELVRVVCGSLIAARLSGKSSVAEANKAHTEAKELRDALRETQAERAALAEKLEATENSLRNKRAMLEKITNPTELLRSDAPPLFLMSLSRQSELLQAEKELPAEREARDSQYDRATEAEAELAKLRDRLSEINEVIASDTDKLNDARHALRTVTEERDVLVTAKNELEATLTEYKIGAHRINNFADIAKPDAFAKRFLAVEVSRGTGSTTKTKRPRGTLHTPAAARRRGAGVKPAAITTAQSLTLKKKGAR